MYLRRVNHLNVWPPLSMRLNVIWSRSNATKQSVNVKLIPSTINKEICTRFTFGF